MYLQEFLGPSIVLATILLLGFGIWFIHRSIKLRKTIKEPYQRAPQAWVQEGKTRTNIKPVNLTSKLYSLPPGRIPTNDPRFEKIEKRLDEAMEENPELLADMFSLYFADMEKFMNSIGITRHHLLARDFFHLKDKLYMLKHYLERRDTKPSRRQVWNYGYYLVLRPYLDHKSMEFNEDTNYHKIYQESIGTEKFKEKQYTQHTTCVLTGVNSYEEFLQELREEQEREINPKLRDIPPDFFNTQE